jgi:hypothetical protein
MVALTGVAGDRTRAATGRALSELASGVLGEPAASSLAANGPMALALALGAVLAAVIVSALALKSLAGAARRRRA